MYLQSVCKECVEHDEEMIDTEAERLLAEPLDTPMDTDGDALMAETVQTDDVPVKTVPACYLCHKEHQKKEQPCCLRAEQPQRCVRAP